MREACLSLARGGARKEEALWSVPVRRGVVISWPRCFPPFTLCRSDMDNLDNYVVLDPLLEKGKGKWSKAAQAERKRGNEWAGRANL